MSNEEIKMIMGDDGIFRKYNDEFDITIHCESKEESDKVKEQLEHINDLGDYIAAITDVDFLEMNYGITNIDIQFVTSFNPEQVIKDHKDFCEWRISE